MGKRLISLILTLTFIYAAFGTMPVKAENEQTGIVAHDEAELTSAAEPDTLTEAEISDGQELPSFSDEIDTFSEEDYEPLEETEEEDAPVELMATSYRGTVIYGDIDNDGDVDSDDSALLLHNYVNFVSLDERTKIASDVDGDGEIDAYDAALILKLVDGNISSLPLIASGYCGDNITWLLKGDGTLTISGTGDMTNWYSGSSTPWYKYGYPYIKKIYISDGVTNIGDNAFYNCTALTSITISNTVTRIGKGAFTNCCYLTSITIPEGVVSIGIEAFLWCNRMTSVSIPNSLINIESRAFERCDSLSSMTLHKEVF